MIFLLWILSLDPFYFIHYSDPQIGRSAAAQSNLATAVNQIDAMLPPPHFIIVAGDMGNNPGNQPLVLEQWQICDSIFDLLSTPKYYVPGNNDIGYEDEGCWTPQMLQFYRDFWGPDYYSFDADSCHFVALNSTLLDTYSPHPCYSYSLEQDSFIRWDMQNIQSQEYKHLFFFFHFPLYAFSPGDPNSHIVVDRPRRDTVLHYLVDNGFTAVFTGHWHLDYMNFYWPSLLQTGLATCGEPPVGYRVVKVFDNGIETFTIYLQNPVDSLPLANIVTAQVDHDTVEVNNPVFFTCVVDSVNFPDWNDLSYKWKFGDGDSSSAPNCSHAYTDTGHYRVVFAAYELHDKCALYRFDIVVEYDHHVQENTVHEPAPFLGLSPTVIEGAISLPQGTKYRVFDITGRIVEPAKITRGIYFVEIDNKVVSKVVKVR